LSDLRLRTLLCIDASVSAAVAAMSEASGWGKALREGASEAIESLAVKALEPVLRRWLTSFNREQLRLQGLKCELYDLDLQASVR